MIEESHLEEFVAWREARAQAEVDLSPRAYLAELENEANRRRIEDAVNILGGVDGVFPSDMDVVDFAQGVLDVAKNALRALVGDRDIIIDQQFNGKAKVILT